MENFELEPEAEIDYVFIHYVDIFPRKFLI